MNNPWNLVIDCAGKSGGLLALSPKHHILQEESWSYPEKHSEALVPKFKKIASIQKLNLLHHVYFISGPGSFTGLRVAAAFIKSLSFYNKSIKVVSLSSFYPFAAQVIKEHDFDRFNILIPSVGGRVFKSTFIKTENLYRENIKFSGAQKSYLDESSTPSFIDDAKILSQNSHLLPLSYCTEDLSFALQKIKQFKLYTKKSSYLDLYPLYLRKSEAEEKCRYDAAT